MAIDERFDDLIASLGGFHRSWLVYLGLELGLFARLREAGSDGMTPAELATATGTHPQAVEAWAWAVDAHDLAGDTGHAPGPGADLLDRDQSGAG